MPVLEQSYMHASCLPFQSPIVQPMDPWLKALMLTLVVVGVCRWLAIGNKPAPAASAAAQPASQQSQAQGASKAADPSRWLSRGAVETLRWQVRAASK